MIDPQSIAFYAAIRQDPETLARLGQAGSEVEFIETIMDEAEKRGFALTAEMVKAALANLPALVTETAQDTELSEMELELVSGGISFSSFVLYDDPMKKGPKPKC